jgi:hypothetical protein
MGMDHKQLNRRTEKALKCAKNWQNLKFRFICSNIARAIEAKTNETRTKCRKNTKKKASGEPTKGKGISTRTAKTKRKRKKTRSKANIRS